MRCVGTAHVTALLQYRSWWTKQCDRCETATEKTKCYGWWGALSASRKPPNVGIEPPYSVRLSEMLGGWFRNERGRK